jgi:hypothetical protein
VSNQHACVFLLCVMKLNHIFQQDQYKKLHILAHALAMRSVKNLLYELEAHF